MILTLKKRYQMPWEDESELTTTTSPGVVPRALSHSTLTLEHRGVRIAADSRRSHLSLGRAEECDVTVRGKFTSRRHADIAFRHGRFHLRDNSTNGTMIVQADGALTRLHREETMLAGNGTLSLGARPEEEPEAAIVFRCE